MVARLTVVLRSLARHRWRRPAAGFVVLILLGVWWVLAAAETRPVFQAISIPADPEALAPASVFALARETQILDLAYSPEGERLYVYVQITTLNAWGALVAFWPEISMMLLGLAAAGVLWRLARRRPTDTDPCCRRCHYLLKHCASDRCPECGLELTARNRVTCRRAWVQIATPIIGFAILFGAFAAGRPYAPRSLGIDTWFDWPSTVLFDWAQYRGGLFRDVIRNHTLFVYRVAEIDPRTGMVLRRFDEPTRRSPARNRMALSGDGRLLAIFDGYQISVRETETGRLRARTTVPPPLRVERRGLENYVEILSDGRSVWAASSTGFIYLLDTQQNQIVSEDYLKELGDLRGHRLPIELVIVFSAYSWPIPEELQRAIRQKNSLLDRLVAPQGSRWYSVPAFIPPGLPGPSRYRTTLGVDPHDRFVVISGIGQSGRGTGDVYTLPSCEHLTTLIGSDLIFRNYAFSGDGAKLAASAWHYPLGRQQVLLATFDLTDLFPGSN